MSNKAIEMRYSFNLNNNIYSLKFRFTINFDVSNGRKNFYLHLLRRLLCLLRSNEKLVPDLRGNSNEKIVFVTNGNKKERWNYLKF